MVGFWEKEYDVLVATTIVESGLDIPNANTLIVDRADMFGLSQLHQLRGRVGRARERGYAYFTYPPERPLTETAYDRLATIAQHTEMGAGMAVAMKDLEIRGSGNLLGGEQSGHIAGVGLRPVRAAGRRGGGRLPRATARTARRNRPRSRSTCRWTPTCRSSTCPASGCGWRRTASLASATTDEAVDAVRAELIDRYGPLPPPVENLLAVARFKVVCRRYGVTEVSLQGSTVRFTPGGAAGVGAAAAAPTVRPVALQGGWVDDQRAASEGRDETRRVLRRGARRRRAAARRGDAGLVRSGARTGHRALSRA